MHIIYFWILKHFKIWIYVIYTKRHTIKTLKKLTL